MYLLFVSTLSKDGPPENTMGSLELEINVEALELEPKIGEMGIRCKVEVDIRIVFGDAPANGECGPALKNLVAGDIDLVGDENGDCSPGERPKPVKFKTIGGRRRTGGAA